jgi:glycosyltransferase involved in cell wall biosynthesis
MRIAVANRYRRIVGGVERYLDTVLPALVRAGHEVAIIAECDVPADRVRIRVPDGSPGWLAGEVASLREWRPDLIYLHELSRPALEESLINVAPAVRFAHGYAGVCVSGTKAFARPAMRPCSRRFGWPCLAAYYPRRCGGLSPLTMWRDFRVNAARLQLAHRYRAIATASEHMRREIIRHGLPPASVHRIGLPIDAAVAGVRSGDDSRSPAASPVRLLFVGRAETLKGGQVALDALPEVARRLERPIKMVFAGDGSALDSWRARAAEIEHRDSRIAVEFAGWLDETAIGRLAADSDLLVVPSLWPEPFGMAGLEAGLARLPAAAFAVGGIPEWLEDGNNGCLAPGDPPNAAALADAIFRCLRDPAMHARLRDGAEKVAREFSLAEHVVRLTDLFVRVAGGDATAGARVRAHRAG